jgi:hypothetical protein
LTASIQEVDGLTQEVQKGRIKGVNIVPLSLKKLLLLLKSKEQKVMTYRSEN